MSGLRERTQKQNGELENVRGEKPSASEEILSRTDQPCHQKRESLFSSGSGFENYRGLLNNCIILLVLSNSKNIIHNFIKYGFLVNPMQLGSRAISANWSLWFLFLVSYPLPLLVLLVEKLAAKGLPSKRPLVAFYSLFFSLILLLPAYYAYHWNIGPAGSFIALCWYTILWLKLMSYVQVNWWCRDNIKASAGKSKLVQYPNNLHVYDMIYFIAAPTLCYELNFPRNPRRRKVFMLRRTLEVVFILNVELAIMQQWIIPTALHSLQPFKGMDWALMIERVFLLAIPNHLFWLLGFYLLFHSTLNLSGEILCFGDRQFYTDWWNAQTIGKFWSSWNIPVHRWASRHLYAPLKSMGYSKLTRQLAVFGLSAFFHEYLVSFPLQMIRPWAFVAMVGQIPLGILTALPFARGQIGNVIVWLSIILGQPVAILMYLHDYYWLNWSSTATPNASTITIA